MRYYTFSKVFSVCLARALYLHHNCLWLHPTKALRGVLHHLTIPLKSNSGLVGLDRVSPLYAENAVRLLEKGFAQFSAWLPVLFVPALTPWFRGTLAELMRSSESIPEAMVTAAQRVARRTAAIASGDDMYEHSLYPPSPTGEPVKAGPRGSRFQLALKVASLLLTGTCVWLVNVGSAAAVVSALIPSPDDTAAAAAAALSSTATSVTASNVGPFTLHLVRRLGVGILASGVVAGASSYTVRRLIVASSVGALETESSPGETENILGFFLIAYAGYAGAFLSTGLATLFGFAAVHVAVQPGGWLSRSSRDSCAPWKAALLPVMMSTAAARVSEAAIDRMSFVMGFVSATGEDS